MLIDLTGQRFGRLTVKGVTRSIKEWSSLTGINYGTLKTRIYAGWNEDKLLQPVNHE